MSCTMVHSATALIEGPGIPLAGPIRPKVRIGAAGSGRTVQDPAGLPGGMGWAITLVPSEQKPNCFRSPQRRVESLQHIQQTGLVMYVRESIEAIKADLDPEELEPTQEAINTTLDLAAILDLQIIPRVTSLGSGDLALEWKHQERAVLLLVLPSGTSRLQQITQTGTEVTVAAIARNPTPEQLLRSLAWLGE